MSPLENLGINPGFLLVQIISFIVLYTLLTRFVYDPLMNVLRERRTRIARGLEDAAEAARARQNAEQEAEKIRAEARSEAARIVEEARGRGDEVAKSIEEEARTEAQKILEDARRDAAATRDQQLSGLRDQVLSISSAVAGRIIRENLDAQRQKQIVDDFFSQIPPEAKSLSGDVTVISAMPLTEEEQKKARQQIGGNITFRVDPAILGGLVVLSGERVIDGSVRRSLGDLTGRLN